MIQQGQTASWYLSYGLHHRLWERTAVAYTGHATIANNLKANGKDKMIVYKEVGNDLERASY